MTVIRPNSITGITSITAQANEINVFRSNGLLAGLNLNGVNFNTTAGISTLAALKVTGNLDVEGVLTYQDVTNVDSLGIGTFRTGINVSGGQLDVGSNIKLGNAGVITATSFVGSGANLTGIALTSLNINGNTNNRIITATGNQYSAQGESRFTFDGNTAEIGDQSSNSTSTLIVSRGEIIGGGTGPVIQLKHGPSSGTQRTHQIYSHVGDLVVQADSNENLKIETGGRESIRITPNSDMGLSNTGTNNPNHYSGWCTFTINGTSGAELDFERGGSLQADILCGQNGLLYTNRLSGDYHAFQTHNGSSVGERLRIKSDGVVLLPTTGKLSVGTTNPVARFQVGPANGSRQIEIEEYGVIRGYDRNSNAWAQIDFEASSYSFDTGGTERWTITSGGDFVPGANDTYDIGSTSAVVRNIFTGDLHLNNLSKEKGNDVDGTNGSWTIQEGQDDLYIINKLNGKKYRIPLEEVN